MSEDIHLKSPLFQRAEQGQLSKIEIAQYLYNLRYMLSQTPTHIVESKKRANELQMATLNEFLTQKLKEESGHDAWASNDLDSLSLRNLEKQSLKLVPAIVDLNEMILKIIKKNPLFYICYSLWAEYITVLLVPRWVVALENKCQILPHSLSVLIKHATLDADHVLENIEVLDRHFDGSLTEEELSHFISKVCDIYLQFGREVVTAGNL